MSRSALYVALSRAQRGEQLSFFGITPEAAMELEMDVIPSLDENADEFGARATSA
jgi:hypothetical protein